MIRLLVAMTLAALVATLASDRPAADAACAVTQPVRAVPPRDPHADPVGDGPWYINADRTIWATWAVGMVAGGSGNKVLWIRPQGTQLTVTGHRLDAEARH